MNPERCEAETLDPVQASNRTAGRPTQSYQQYISSQAAMKEWMNVAVEFGVKRSEQKCAITGIV